MKKQFKNLMFATILVAASTTVHAQPPNWLTSGNSGSTTTTPFKLGYYTGDNLEMITNGKTRMIVRKTTGRVGIGTIAPSSPVNQLQVDVTTPEDGIRIVQYGANGINGAAALHLKNNTPGGKMWSLLSLGSGNTIQGSGNFLIQESDDYGVNYFDRFIIQKTTGNVGIGTVTPAEKLEVFDGDARIHGLTVGLGGGFITTNSANGYQALFSNTSGSQNYAAGYQAMYNNKTGTQNSATGYQSIYTNTAGTNNTAYGYQSLYSGGNYSTAIGARALYSGGQSLNCALGADALYSLGSLGSWNTAIGTYSLRGNKDGSENTAVGYRALSYGITGQSNVAVGMLSQYISTGDYDASIGSYALYSNTTGGANTAMGYNALSVNTTGSYNTAVGYGANVSGNNFTNAVALGANAIVTASNKIQLGDNSITFVTMAGPTVLTSDGRFKKNIKSNVPGLEFINLLNPITYNYDIHKLNEFVKPSENEGEQKKINPLIKKIKEAGITKKEKIIYSGFIAQDVEKAAAKLNYDFSGVYKPQNDKDPYGISYEEFVVPLVKAVQELSKENDDLKSQLSAINTRLEALENMSASSSQNNAQLTNSSNAYLYQIAPNPFSQKATISFKLTASASNAQLLISDATGKTVKTYSLANNSTQQDIYADNLTAGVYHYSLVVNGKMIDSKQMVITK